MNVKLHYIFDPLCGWCYAASPLLAALSERFGSQLELVLHPGLLFAQPSDIAPAYREHIVSADRRIAALTGVDFGASYIERVRHMAVLRYHSEPPAAAVLAVMAQQPELGLPMLEAIQRSHYVHGANVSDVATLSALALNLGLDASEFACALPLALAALPVAVDEARRLLDEVGGSGFPALVLERDSQYLRLDHSSAYGQPQVLVARVAQLMASA